MVRQAYAKLAWRARSAFPLTPHLINWSLVSSLSRFLLEKAIRALVKDEYDEVNYKVLNIGAVNFLCPPTRARSVFRWMGATSKPSSRLSRLPRNTGASMTFIRAHPYPLDS